MKKRKKRKRGVAFRRQKIAKQQLKEGDDGVWREEERKRHRLKKLEQETQEIFNKVIAPYTLSDDEKDMLRHEWEGGLYVIEDFEDTTPEGLLELPIDDHSGTTLKELVETWDGLSESFWRASYELANALGLAMITIDEEGTLKGLRVGY